MRSEEPNKKITMKICPYINNQEKAPVEWPVIPDVGSYIELDDSETYKVTKICHMLRRNDKSILVYAEKERI